MHYLCFAQYAKSAMEACLNKKKVIVNLNHNSEKLRKFKVTIVRKKVTIVRY